MPDSPFNSVLANANSLKAIPVDIWTKVFGALSQTDMAALGQFGINATVVTTNTCSDTVFTALQTTAVFAAEDAAWSVMPSINLLITSIKIFQNPNGWFLLPILSAGTQILMTLTQPQTAGMDANGQAASTNKIMKYFFPLFTLYICATSNAAFALYWVTSNVYAWIEGLIINKVLEKKALETKTSIEEGSLK